MSREIFIAHFNQDYNEWSFAETTKGRVIEEVAKAFDVDFALYDEDAPDPFWQEVFDEYEHGNWKGFSFQKLDTWTLQFEEVS